MDLQWYDYIRVATALGALGIIYAQMHRAKRLWAQYNSRLKDYWWAYSMSFFVLGEGSLEAIIKDVGPTTTLWLKIIAVSIGLVAVWRAREVGERNKVHDVY